MRRYQDRTGMMDIPLQGNVDQDYYGVLADRGELVTLRNFVEPRPSRRKRYEMGKQLRKQVPRAEHALWHPAPNRLDPVTIIKRQNATRVQKLVPLRTARMLASPFAFLRGSAAVMAADLARTPSTGLHVVACGDMHVVNFGVFASAERQLIFAINDFDEVYPAPWEWDVKRLASSAAVATRFMGGDRADSECAALAVAASYREHMRRYAEMPFLQVWYDKIDDRTILDASPLRVRRLIEATFNKARAKGHLRSLGKMTAKIDGEHRIAEDIPLIVRETHRDDGVPMSTVIDTVIRSYLSSLADDRKRLETAHRSCGGGPKVGGGRSRGTKCLVGYLEGLDDDDPLFLQIKQALPSVLAPHSSVRLPYGNQGRRVVTGQRLTQGSPDIFLGWGESEGGRHFYVRQLADMKGSIQFAEGERDRLEEFPL